MEGEYLVAASTDNNTYYKLIAFTDLSNGTARGEYVLDLTQYFDSSGTVYLRITDYHPLDNNSPIIYSLRLNESEDRELG